MPVSLHRSRLTANRAITVLAAVLLMVVVTSARATTQTPATGRLMRQKLIHAQRLLEAITTSNYALLERETTGLVAIPQSPGWMVLNSPEYRKYSEAFRRASQALLDAAKNRDLDKAVGVYQDVTMSCYRCHQYIKNMRLAK
jgi:hypothetical protein